MSEFGPITACCGCMFVVCFAIWCGCFFGIYFPFLRDFKAATCTLKETFPLYSSYESEGEPLYNYRQLLMNVYIDEKEYTGMGCEAESYRMSTVNYDSPWGAYPYQYALCDSWDNSTYDCSYQQVVQARWLCEDWSKTSKFVEGVDYKCWYAIMNSNDKLGDVSLYKKYPHEDKAYLEVIFQESPYYPEAEYLVLQILCLGVFCILPFISLVFILLPAHCDFKPYTCPCKFCAKYVWRRGIRRIYKYCRRRVCVCIPYYDQSIRVENRALLFAHAFSYTKQMRMKPRLARGVREYIAHM